MHVDMCMYMYLHVCVCVYVCGHVYACGYVHVCGYVYVCDMWCVSTLYIRKHVNVAFVRACLFGTQPTGAGAGVATQQQVMLSWWSYLAPAMTLPDLDQKWLPSRNEWMSIPLTNPCVFVQKTLKKSSFSHLLFSAMTTFAFS